MKQRIHDLKTKIQYLSDETRLLATEAEIHAVKSAAGACLAAGVLTVVLSPGPFSIIFLALPLIAIGVALVVALERTVAFRHRRLAAGQCGHPFCHGVVQHSANAPAGHVICPTCKHVWPEIPGMEFHITQRGQTSVGPVHHFM